MNLVPILIKFAIVIMLGVVIFYVGRTGILPQSLLITIICLLALGKAIHLMTFSFKKIVEVSVRNIPYHTFLGFVAVNVSLIVVSCSIDFFCLYEADVHSFSGVNQEFATWERYLDFLYYSVLGFTNFGIDQIDPQSFPAKFITVLELLISFATIIFVLSDFISLKESISGVNRTGKKEEEKK